MFQGSGQNSPNYTLILGDKFYTSNVKNMIRLFENTGFANNNLVLDLSTLDFSSVTNFNNIFNNVKASTTIYVKDEAAQAWVIASHSNLTSSNVLIKP